VRQGTSVGRAATERGPFKPSRSAGMRAPGTVPLPCKTKPLGEMTGTGDGAPAQSGAFGETAEGGQSIGQGWMFQMSFAYSPMVRSVLNLPLLAMFMMHIRAQRVRSA